LQLFCKKAFAFSALLFFGERLKINFMEIGKIIRQRRKQLNMTQEELALEVNSDAGNLSRVENGKQGIPLDKIELYAKALRCRPADLLVEETQVSEPPLPLGFIRIPLLDAIQAFNWDKLKSHTGELDISDWLISSADISTDSFGFKIMDFSMMPEFKQGELVIIDPELTPEAGDIVLVATVNRDVLLRKYKQRGISDDGSFIYELHPLNDDFEILSSTSSELKILGVMVEHRRLRRNRL